MTDSTLEIISDDAMKVVVATAEILLLAGAGNGVGAGLRAAELAVDLVPPEVLRAHLTAKGVQLANKAADALDKAKFGG